MPPKMFENVRARLWLRVFDDDDGGKINAKTLLVSPLLGGVFFT